MVYDFSCHKFDLQLYRGGRIGTLFAFYAVVLKLSWTAFLSFAQKLGLYIH